MHTGNPGTGAQIAHSADMPHQRFTIGVQDLPQLLSRIGPERQPFTSCNEPVVNEKLFSTSGNRKAMLDLFAECLDAAKGFRQQT